MISVVPCVSIFGYLKSDDTLNSTESWLEKLKLDDRPFIMSEAG